MNPTLQVSRCKHCGKTIYTFKHWKHWTHDYMDDSMSGRARYCRKEIKIDGSKAMVEFKAEPR